jgi:hypothetical protein
LRKNELCRRFAAHENSIRFVQETFEVRLFTFLLHSFVYLYKMAETSEQTVHVTAFKINNKLSVFAILADAK